MKKLIIVMTTIITMMLYVAAPIMYKPFNSFAISSLGVTDDNNGSVKYVSLPAILDHYGENLNYIYLSCYNDDGSSGNYCLLYNEADAVVDDVTSAGYRRITITNPTINGNTAIVFRRTRSKSGQIIDNNRDLYEYKNISSFTFIEYPNSLSSHGPFAVWYSNGSINSSSFNFLYSDDSSQYNIDRSYSINIENNSNRLNLQVSFAYPFSGTMTRHTTGDNGLPTAAEGNIMYIDNRRGADAQFLMAIVPHGQTLSFNTWIYTGRDNIIGNPQYVYLCDEWQTFGALSAINIGDSTASANSIYAACAWHASPAGSTRSYNLMYESMDLKANTEYDVLVYACLNPDMEEMSGFYYDNNNLGGTYSVCGSLSDVQLVYTSTFSMTDPVKFNPDYKNVHDSSYAWNPNDTNAGLWENGSAYKDENGNVVIKGFKTGASTLSWENSGSGSGYGNISGGSGANINVQKSFGGFFGFFKGLLGLLPMEYNLLIIFGLVGLVAIALIKAVM